MRRHVYDVQTEWTGNDGTGTATYRSYRRDHVIVATGKAAIAGSADPVFRGDATRYNPEELLVAALSSCHMLAYLHLCAVNRIIVTAYSDAALGVMEESAGEGGSFASVTLHPRVSISAGSATLAASLHRDAHEACFIARSVNFPVTAEAVILAA